MAALQVAAGVDAVLENDVIYSDGLCKVYLAGLAGPRTRDQVKSFFEAILLRKREIFSATIFQPRFAPLFAGVLSREKAELERDRGFDLVNTSEEWGLRCEGRRRVDFEQKGFNRS